MNLHGANQDVTSDVVLTVTSPGKINGTSIFKLMPENYAILIPSAIGMNGIRKAKSMLRIVALPRVKRSTLSI